VINEGIAEEETKATSIIGAARKGIAETRRRRRGWEVTENVVARFLGPVAESEEERE
jgi:hypothetical protein